VAAVRASLMGAISAMDAPAERLDRPLGRVLEAAIEAFAGALSTEAEQRLPEAPFAAVEQRAAMVRAALAATAG
jgi:hypothetical protein